jgi:hypothetical protein
MTSMGARDVIQEMLACSATAVTTCLYTDENFDRRKPSYLLSKVRGHGGVVKAPLRRLDAIFLMAVLGELAAWPVSFIIRPV